MSYFHNHQAIKVDKANMMRLLFQKSPSGPIKFTHFGDGGRCEPLLMIFAYSGIEFENEIIAMDDWPAMKPSELVKL